MIMLKVFPTMKRPHFFAIPFSFLIVLLNTIQLHGDQPVQYVATGARIGVISQSTDEIKTAFWHRSPHQLGGPVSEIQVGFMNWLLNYSEEVAISNEVTIYYAWLERESDGQVVPLTFAGGRELVMPGNDVEPYWLSDPIDSSVWTGGIPQRDDVFWLHIKGGVPANGRVSQGTPTGYSGSKFVLYDPANDPGTFDTAGSVPSISGQNARTRGLPVMFLGRFTEPGYLSVIGIGDSILDGSGDVSRNYSSISGFGFFCRAAVDESGVNAIATFNLTRHGAASSAPTRETNPRQRHFLKYANVAVEEYGTNDLNSRGTGDVSTIQERLDALWSLCREEGIQKIIRTQLMPRTTSESGNWVSLADQTPNTGWGDAAKGDSGKRDELNAGFQASLARGDIDLVLENLAVVSDPTDDHYWLSDGSNDYMTSDGTHLKSTANAFVASVLRDALLNITVDEEGETYSLWEGSIDWGSEDSSPSADPNKDGISNALAYALDLPPLGPASTLSTPYVSYDTEMADGPWLDFVFRQNVYAEDVTFTYLSSMDLNADWDALVVDNSNVIEETIDMDPDGDGSAILKRLRVKFPDAPRHLFLKLEVDLAGVSSD